MSRYIVCDTENPGEFRIRDQRRGRYIKQSHGTELWPEDGANEKADELNGHDPFGDFRFVDY